MKLDDMMFILNGLYWHYPSKFMFMVPSIAYLY